MLTSIDLYMDECRDHPILSAEEELDLIARAQNGDQDACDQLVRCNQRFIIQIANKYMIFAGDQDLADMIQWGNIGLVTAIKKFDLNSGYRLITYAYYWIRMVIRREGLIHGATVTRSSQAADISIKIRKAISDLSNKNHRDPTVEEIAAHVGLPLSRVKEVMPLLDSSPSLDSNISSSNRSGEDQSQTLGDMIPDPETSRVEELVEIRLLMDSVSDLPETWAKVITYRYGLNGEPVLSFREIARVLNMSPQRCQQIDEQAKNTLRKSLVNRRARQLSLQPQ